MATATRPAKKAAKAAPAKRSAYKHGNLLGKSVTGKQQSFIDYVKVTTGVDLDPESTRLTLALYGTFQKSPENQAAIKAQKDGASQRIVDREKAAAERAEKRAAREKAAAERKANPPAKKAAAKKVPAKKAAPAKKTAKKAPAKAAPKRRAAKAAASEDF